MFVFAFFVCTFIDVVVDVAAYEHTLGELFCMHAHVGGAENWPEVTVKSHSPVLG